MSPTIVNPSLIVFIIATAFGVIMHDTQVDKASVAITTPSHFTNYAASEVSKSTEHVHVERVSITNQGSSTRNTPKTQPRDDDRKYIQSKKVALHSGNGAGLWPSV